MVLKKNKDKRFILLIIGAILLILSTILIMCFALKGETIISDKHTENTKNDSLYCLNDEIAHTYANYDNSKKKTLIISVLFYNNKLKTISLIYNLYYDDSELITSSEANNHAAMNKSFSKTGVEANTLSPNYSKQKDKVTITLFTEAKDFDNKLAKYYMADSLTRDSTLENFLRNYEQQGFICNTNKESNEK